MAIAARNRPPETPNLQRIPRHQRFHSVETIAFERPGDPRDQTWVHRLSGLGSGHHPAPPNRRDALSIGGRHNLIRAVNGRDGPSVFQLEKGNQAWVDLLHGHSETRKSMWRRLIVGCCCLRPSHKWQFEMDMPLADDPHPKLAAWGVTEVLKARQVSKAQLRRKTFHSFFFECFNEDLVGSDHLSEKRCSLLPFPFFCYVAVVASAEREYGQQVRLIMEVPAQPRPCSKISGRKLWQRSRPELRVLPEERGSLHGVHVTDRAEAPSPGITVAVGRQQIPPEFH